MLLGGDYNQSTYVMGHNNTVREEEEELIRSLQCCCMSCILLYKSKTGSNK